MCLYSRYRQYLLTPTSNAGILGRIKHKIKMRQKQVHSHEAFKHLPSFIALFITSYTLLYIRSLKSNDTPVKSLCLFPTHGYGPNSNALQKKVWKGAIMTVTDKKKKKKGGGEKKRGKKRQVLSRKEAFQKVKLASLNHKNIFRFCQRFLLCRDARCSRRYQNRGEVWYQSGDQSLRWMSGMELTIVWDVLKSNSSNSLILIWKRSFGWKLALRCSSTKRCVCCCSSMFRWKWNAGLRSAQRRIKVNLFR